jgi:hypothetical protein
MTGSDLLVLVPWTLFGAGLVVVCLRLRRTRQIAQRASVPGPRRTPPTARGEQGGEPAGAVPRPAGRDRDSRRS